MGEFFHLLSIAIIINFCTFMAIIKIHPYDYFELKAIEFVKSMTCIQNEAAASKELIMKKHLPVFLKEVSTFIRYSLPLFLLLFLIAKITEPGYLRRRSHGRSSKDRCFFNQNQIGAAIDMYCLDNAKQYTIKSKADFETLVKMRYLQSEPTCDGLDPDYRIPYEDELHEIGIYSTPASIYAFSSSHTKKWIYYLKKDLGFEKEGLHEYRADNCGNIWCTLHGPTTYGGASGKCIPCDDGGCEESLRLQKKR
jgi:hypothetical protein